MDSYTVTFWFNRIGLTAQVLALGKYAAEREAARILADAGHDVSDHDYITITTYPRLFESEG